VAAVDDDVERGGDRAAADGRDRCVASSPEAPRTTVQPAGRRSVDSATQTDRSLRADAGDSGKLRE